MLADLEGTGQSTLFPIPIHYPGAAILFVSIVSNVVSVKLCNGVIKLKWFYLVNSSWLKEVAISEAELQMLPSLMMFQM